MDVFAPETLPGVGMGDLESLTGIAGVIGLASTAGMLLGAGGAGAVAWMLAAGAVLGLKDLHAYGDRSAFVVPVMVAIGVLGWFSRTGSAKVPWFVGGAVGSAAMGFVWAEWNEAPFAFDGESAVGMALGLAAGLVGGFVARAFIEGSVRGGGSATIVAVTVVAVALVLNAVAFYVPFAGVAVFALLVVAAARMRARGREKYKGLRILS